MMRKFMGEEKAFARMAAKNLPAFVGRESTSDASV
jgi:hypothetical protein